MESVKTEASRENSQTKTTETLVSSASQNINDQMNEHLKILAEETLQLSELLWQEDKLAKEFCALLKHVLRQLNMSFNLPADAFPERGRVQQIILNDEAHLILINDKNEVQSKALDDYPTHVIFNLASFIIPELSKSLTLQRKKIDLRIDFFDRVNRELRSLCNTFEDHSKKPEEGGNPVDDGVKKALLTQQKSLEGL